MNETSRALQRIAGGTGIVLLENYLNVIWISKCRNHSEVFSKAEYDYNSKLF